jgi:dihydroxy-acid dehydratase
MPCNINQRELAETVKAGIRAAGGTPMEFNTIAISDGVTMGTEGMKTSLVSREVVADSIELFVRGQLLDGVVCIVACDKTVPARPWALGRLDVPGIIALRRDDQPGVYKGQRNATVVSVYEAIGLIGPARSRSTSSTRSRTRPVPDQGACGGQFTGQHDEHGHGVHRALAGRPQRHPGRGPVQGRAPTAVGELVMDLVRATSALARSSRATRSRTASRASPRPAARPTASCTCWRSPTSSASRSTSTSSAHRRSRRRSIGDMQPGGRYTAPTCTRRAASRSSCASCSSARACSTATRRRRRPDDRRDRAARRETPGQQVVVPIETPLKPNGGLAILRGSLAPDGCVVKLAGHERRHTAAGPRVRLGGRLLRRGPRQRIVPATSSSSATRAGRRPGMQEMLQVTAALVGEGSATPWRC